MIYKSVFKVALIVPGQSIKAEKFKYHRVFDYLLRAFRSMLFACHCQNSFFAITE